MKIQTDSLDKQRKRCADFAKEYDIPLQDIYAKAEEEYEKIYPKVYDNILKKKGIQKGQQISAEENEIISKAAKKETERRSLIRARSVFKRKAFRNKQIKKNGIPAFILMRFRDNDFENRAAKKIDEYIAEKGEEEAIKLQYIDNDGNYLHCNITNSSPDQYGQKIDKDKVKGSAIGFFEIEKDGVKQYDARFIRSNRIDKVEMPICQACTADITEGKYLSTFFEDKNTYWINGAIADSNNPIVSLSFANNIMSLCDKFLKSDNFVETYQDFINVCTTQIESHNKNIYAGVNATCSAIIPGQDSDANILCEFEIYDDENEEINSIAIYVPPERFVNMALIEGTSGILFVTDMYFNKDGEIGYHLGGFLPIEQGE